MARPDTKSPGIITDTNITHEKKFKVVVAHGRSIMFYLDASGRIHHGKVTDARALKRKLFKGGDEIEVNASEVDRLFLKGFIKDPYGDKLPSGAEGVDISSYFRSSDGPAPELMQRGTPLHTPQA